MRNLRWEIINNFDTNLVDYWEWSGAKEYISEKWVLVFACKDRRRYSRERARSRSMKYQLYVYFSCWAQRTASQQIEAVLVVDVAAVERLTLWAARSERIPADCAYLRHGAIRAWAKTFAFLATMLKRRVQLSTTAQLQLPIILISVSFWRCTCERAY